MSPLNHWGYAIWRNAKPDMKKQLTKKTQAELFTATRHIPANWFKFLHMDFSLNKDVEVNWADHRKTLQRLIDLTGLRSDRLNTMLDGVVRWQELTYDEKIKVIGRLYWYAQQFVPRSSLFARLRVLQNNMLLNATGKNDQMVEGLLKTISALTEDGEEGSDMPAGIPVSVATGTSSSDIASLPTRIGGPAMVIKRKRNKDVVQRLTMKFPDPRKTEE
jgi:hypothetical protein